MRELRTPTGNAEFAVNDILLVTAVDDEKQPTVVVRIGPADEEINRPPQEGRLARLWDRIQHWVSRMQEADTSQEKRDA